MRFLNKPHVVLMHKHALSFITVSDPVVIPTTRITRANHAMAFLHSSARGPEKERNDRHIEVQDELKNCRQNKRALVVAKAKPKPIETVDLGEVVLCKLKGYPAWPARVTAMDKNIITVKFFGDESTARTSIKNCFNFLDSVDLVLTILRSRKSPLYAKSIKETEFVLGIPPSKSILNRVN